MAEQDVGLVIPILGDISGLQNAMSQATDSVKSAMGQVKEAMGAVGLMAAGYLKSAVESAAKGEENFANLKQTIKSTGEAAGFSADQIKSMSKELSAQTTFSSGEIMKGQNMLLTFTNIQGDVLKKASMAMLDLSQKYGTAPENQAIALGKALNDPIKGITALTRVGVTFTEQQKEQIKTMEESGNMAGAQNIILKELNTEFGGQAGAAVNTYNGQLKQMTNSMNSIKGAIGGVLLPYFSELATKLNSTAQFVAKFAADNKQLIAIILSVTAVFGSLIGGVSLFSKVSSILGPVVTGLSTLIGGLAAPIIIIIAAIAGLGIAYKENFGGFKTFVDGIIKDIAIVGSSIVKIFKGDIPGAFDALGNVFGKNTTKISSVLIMVIDSIKVFFDILTGNFKGATKILEQFSTNSNSMCSNVIKFFARLALNIQEYLSQMVTWFIANLPKIEEIVGKVFAKVAEIFTNVLIPIIKIAIDVIASLVNWIVAHWPDIQAVIKVVVDIIVALFKDVLIPAFKFVIDVISQVVKWVSDNWPLISNTIKIVLDTVWDIISTVLNKIKIFWDIWGKTIMDLVSVAFNNIKIVISTVIKVIEDIIKAVMLAINGDWAGAWNALIQAVKDIFGGLGAIIQNILDGIGKIFMDMATVAFNWGANMIDGFIKGIMSKISAVKDAVNGGIMNTVQLFLGHNSPAKEGPGQHIVEWGANMISGFMDGIKLQTPNLQSLMNTVMKAPSLSSNVNMSLSSSSSGGYASANSNIYNITIDAKNVSDFNKAIDTLSGIQQAMRAKK